MAKIIQSKRKLTALGLSNNQIGTEGAMHIASTALADKLSLTKLSLEGNSIGSRGLRAISEAMMANTELKEIYLYNNQIEDDGLDIFGKMIQNKSHLFAIGLEFNKIGAEGVSHVLMGIKQLRGLEKLYLNANDIKATDQLGNAFIESLSKCESLKEIRLSNNRLGDEGGIPLAKALKLNKSIRVCHVSNNKLSAESAKEFAELIKANQSLKDLDLSSNMIIMEELQILADAFKESALECLNLRNNLISSEEILAFDSVLAFVANLPKRKFLF